MSTMDEPGNDPGEVTAEEIAITSQIEPPPDGRYGRVCVAACFNINCFTWGVVAVRAQIVEITGIW
jgi:hypothetical protein